MEKRIMDLEVNLARVCSDILMLQSELSNMEDRIHQLETATPDEECGCDSQDN